MKNLVKVMLFVSIIAGTLVSVKLLIDLYDEKIKRHYISTD